MQVQFTKTNVPPVTLAIIIVCVALWASLNFAPEWIPLDAVAPQPPRLWHAAPWGLVTSAFVHLAFWHVAFNVWWTRDLGRILEPKVGRTRFAVFVLVAAFVTSLCEVLASGSTGIGFSGVVYALFGFILARRKMDADFGAFLTPSVIGWMIGWLVLCIGLTLAKVWSVGNAAHVSGLILGWAAGRLLPAPPTQPAQPARAPA